MIDIPSNFGAKFFETEEEAVEYLRKLGFTLISSRSGYDVYETEKEPKTRATMYQQQDGLYFVGQLVEKK